LLFVIAVFVIAAHAANPVPAWPVAYSATMDIFRHSQQRYFVARWFRDEQKSIERFDTSGTDGWDIDIRRYDLGTRYNVYHFNGELACVAANLTTTMSKLDFSAYKWRGKVSINGRAADQFDAPSPNMQYTQYFQDSVSFDPARLVTGGPNDETIDFYEFDRGTQDPSLFDVTVVAPGLTCNKSPMDGVALLGGDVRMAWLDAPHHATKVNYYTPPSMTNGNVTSGACESGDASWYDCSGTAACGGCNTSQMIAAHKTIACGTAITVTNTQNGKSVQVKVADRGPYVAGRIVDMNRAPANSLDMISAGVVPARLCY